LGNGEFVRLRLFVLTALVSINALATTSNLGMNSTWLPVTDAELRMTAPVVDKDAGVEALFWRVYVVDELSGDARGFQRTLYHYVRLKVFNEEGKRKAATFEIGHGEHSGVLFVTGRTVKPDGTIVELSKDAIHERTALKTGGYLWKVTSLAMPGVEVGSIVEYRWRETRDETPRYLRMPFQMDYPARKVTWFVKPVSIRYVADQMSARPFDCQPSPPKVENDGFVSISLENVPAFREEPMMPGEAGIRPWVLVFYHRDAEIRDPGKYWTEVGKTAYNELKQSLKTNGELKQVTAQTVQGAKDDNEKAIRLIRYIRANVRNVYDRQVSEAERAGLFNKMPRDRARTSAEILKGGLATPGEMNVLFAALASEAGLESRPVLISDKSDIEFNEQLVDSYFLRNVNMAVRIGDQWRIFDVSARLLSPQMLSWREEGTRALLADPKRPEFITAPYSLPDDSLSRRIAKLSLSDDGTLEGEVDQQWTGHRAHEYRTEYDGETESGLAERWKDRILRSYPQAEIGNLRIANAEKPEQPLELHYHIRIPGYAARTGKRLLVQPLFFQHGVAPLFSTSQRQYDVSFQYAWHEHDEVTIALPAGFETEKAGALLGVPLGAVGSYKLSVSTGGGEVVCTRDFTFGERGSLMFQREVYPKLKTIFDRIHASDNQMLSFRQTGAAAGGQ
jgi:hypothetical protein